MPKQERRWRAATVSAFLHVLIAAAIFGLTPQPEYPLLEPERGFIMLRVPDPLYYSPERASGDGGKRDTLSHVSARQSGRPAADAPDSGGPDLPPAPILSGDGSLLLQPRPPRRAVIPAPVPPLAFWSRQQPLDRRKLITPGRQEPAAPLPEISPAPKLDIPNREDMITGINVGQSIPVAVPALPVPASATTPVKLFRPRPAEPAEKAGTLDPVEGDPAHVLSASAPIFPVDRIVPVPAGILAPVRAGGAGSGGDDKGGAGATQGSEGGQQGTGKDATGKDGTVGRGTSSRPGTGNTVGSSGTRKKGEGTTPAARAPLFERPTTTILPDRSVHTVYPPNGSFDVVVVQSTLANAFPEGAGILAGKPIYTVYLHVGPGKEWILQYCLPAPAASAQPHRQVINLAESSGIQAPFPISTTIPALESRNKYVLVHGVLAANGRFRNLKLATRSIGVLPEDLLPYLETWLFQPATQSGRAIDVEALLAIPPT